MTNNRCLFEAMEETPFSDFSIHKFSSSLFLIFILALPFQLWAQPPVNAYFNPENFEDGDEIELVIEYGDEENQLEKVNSLHFEIGYSGFEVDESSVLSVDAGGTSWFGGDGNYNAWVEVDPEGHLFIVDLERTSGLVSGFGYVARVKGIIVEVEEISAKRGPFVSGSTARSHSTKLLSSELFFNQMTQSLQLGNTESLKWNKLDMIDLTGRVVFTSEEQQNSLYIGHLPGQIYIARLHTVTGIRARKILVIP